MSLLSARVLGSLLGSLSLSSLSAMYNGMELLSDPFGGVRHSPRHRTSKKDRARMDTYEAQLFGKRKLHRTVRAQTKQGLSLQYHFDSNRLTRSQMKKFYAGKAVY